MATLDMEGPFELNASVIDQQITKASSGNYALGQIDPEDNKFIVRYVGRSDAGLNARLKKHAEASRHPHFKYSYATSPKAAFEKECKNFHEFGGTKIRDNHIHPDRPDNSGWKCPYCTDLD